MEMIDLASYTCPRCAQTVGAEFYGPCADCHQDLRAKMLRQGEAVEAAEYEPKMNVTPNAVALKE